MYKTSADEKRELIQRLIILIFGILFLLTLGMVWFHFSEGWDFKFSLYYSGISLMSRGFSDVFPKTWSGVLFSLLYTLLGLGFIIYYVTSLISFFINYYEKGMKKKVNNLIDTFKKKEKKKKSGEWIDMRNFKD